MKTASEPDKNASSGSFAEEDTDSVTLSEMNSNVLPDSDSNSEELTSDSTLVPPNESIGFQDTPWRKRKEEEKYAVQLQKATEIFLNDYQNSHLISDYHKQEILKVVKQKNRKKNSNEFKISCCQV
jgi:hypothetical protein